MRGNYLAPNKIKRQKTIFLKKRLTETKFIVPWMQYDDTTDVNDNNIIHKKRSLGKSSSKILIKEGIVMLDQNKSNEEKVK